MAKRNRDTLTGFFRGAIPPTAYGDLIESTFNLLDDGMDVDKENGLKLSAKGASHKLISFYEQMGDRNPAFSIGLQTGPQQGLHFTERGKESRLFLQEGGNVGIGTSQPGYRLEVAGLVAMEGRVGSFAKGYVDADAEWHTILDNIDGCRAFEVMAQINDDKDQRHALTYAVLLIAAGKRGTRKQVRTVRAGSPWFWGRIWNKIGFRWRIDEANSTEGHTRYKLQMRSRTHYGKEQGRNKQIFYRITLLWDRNFEQASYQPPVAEPEPERREPRTTRPTPPPPPRETKDEGPGGIRINKR